MTFTEQAAEFGRIPCVIVELDLDRCTNVYGEAPCAAAVGVSGTQKCFNTRRTCQDPTNFARGTRTYRFSDQVLPPGSGIVAIPSIVSVSTAPCKIDPGNTLGYRASVTVQLRDHPWHDVGALGTDPYWRERDYTPDDRGTFWGKLMARSPYYQARTMRVRSGYLVATAAHPGGEYDAANFETRTYVLDQISGPDASGKVKVTAKDALALATDDRAQAPSVSTGALYTDLAAGVTTATLTPVGVGDSEYPASGYAIMGDEVVSFTRTADVLTLVRGQFNTEDVDHEADDAVQLCKVYTDTPVTDVVYDLLTVHANVPTSYIDKAAWDAEALVWLPTVLLSVVIIKPTGVTQLLTELTQQALFYLWWDERVQLIQFKAVRPSSEDETTTLDDDANNLAETLSLTETPDDRVSQVWVYYGLTNPTADIDKEKNYRNVLVNADLAAEAPEQYGEQRIKKVFARWLPAANTGVALTLGARILAKYRNNPRRIRVRLDAKDCALWTADAVRLSSRYVQTADGGAESIDMQVLEVRETKQGSEYEYELADSFFQGRFGFITPDDMPDYDAATEAQRRRYGFISRDDELFYDGTDAYKII